MGHAGETVAFQATYWSGVNPVQVYFYQDEVFDVRLPDDQEEIINLMDTRKSRLYTKHSGVVKIQVEFRIRTEATTLQKLITLRNYSRTASNTNYINIYFRSQHAGGGEYENVFLPGGQIPDAMTAHGYDRRDYRLNVEFIAPLGAVAADADTVVDNDGNTVVDNDGNSVVPNP